LGYKYGSLPIAVIDTEKHIKISQTLKDNNLNDFIVDVYSGNEQDVNKIIDNKNILFEKLVETEKYNTNKILEILNKIFLQ